MKSSLIAFVAALALATGSARAEDKKVVVENTTANPVPTVQTGTAAVTVTNTPSVNVANTASVKVTNTAAVTIANTPAVTISNTPAVTISNTPTVNVGTLPAITLASPITVQAAALTPTQGGVHITIAAGSTTGVGNITVPAGQTLVIESVSVVGDMAPGTSYARIITSGGPSLVQAPSFSLPLIADAFGSESTVSLKLYASAGSQITFEIELNAPAGGQIDANCGFSGYVVSQ